MHAMKMHATAEAFEHQSGSNQWADLSFEDRVGMLVDAEWTSREQRKTIRRLQAARLRYPASLVGLSTEWESESLPFQILLPIEYDGDRRAGPLASDRFPHDKMQPIGADGVVPSDVAVARNRCLE